jgi:hypothetical protein
MNPMAFSDLKETTMTNRISSTKLGVIALGTASRSTKGGAVYELPDSGQQQKRNQIGPSAD